MREKKADQLGTIKQWVPGFSFCLMGVGEPDNLGANNRMGAMTMGANNRGHPSFPDQF